MKFKFIDSKYSRYLSLLILLIAVLLLRFVGLNHGYPFIYNSDEPTMVRTMMSIRFFPIIDRFDWPHFNYYFQYVFFFIFIKIRGLSENILQKQSFPIVWEDPFIFYLVARAVSVTLSILTAVPIYLSILKILKNKKIALISAVIFLFLPYVTLNSRLAIQDTALTFWISIAIYFLLRYLDRWLLKDIFFAVVFLALATGVKYNAMLFMLLVPSFIAINIYVNKIYLQPKKLINLFFLCIGLVFLYLSIFVVTTPGIIFHWSDFWSYKFGVGFLWQLRDNLDVYPIKDYPAQVLGDFMSLLADTAYIPGLVWILSIPYLLKSNIKRNYKFGLIVLISFSYFYALNASRYLLSGSRFYLPVYGIIIISLSIFLQSIQSRYIKFILIIFCFIFEALFQYYLVRQFLNPTTLNEAYIDYVDIRNKGNEIFVKGEYMERINKLHNLKMNILEKSDRAPKGSYLFSRLLNTNESDQGWKIIDKIDANYTICGSVYFKDRLGPPIYIYIKTE